MILIADSGSTKTDWALINPENNSITNFHTIGYNPYFINTESIISSLNENLVKYIDSAIVQELYFYGAGCASQLRSNIVKDALNNIFPKGRIFIGHDLLGSARALLGKENGFAAILGTGANTCIYDGNDCIQNIDSLGYLLGDEGSGSYIGKKIVRDFMRNRLEPELHNRFKERFQIENNEQIFQTLYTSPFPNRYLASFCKFADEYVSHPYIKNKVRDSFNDFFKNLVCKYPNYNQHTFNCVGSVGYVFKDILIEVANRYEMKVGKIIQSPLKDLVNFHLENR
jgi:glucosamine kinase